MLSFLTYFVKLGITDLGALTVKLYQNIATFFYYFDTLIIYGMFYRFGLIDVPDEVKENMRKNDRSNKKQKKHQKI